MKVITLNGTERDNLGRTSAKALRSEGLVPCVIYGEKDPVHISIDNREFDKIIYTHEVFIVDIKVGDKTITTILKDTQFHPVTDKLEHADFLEVTREKPITISLPITLTGNAIGVLNGGRLSQPLRYLKVKAMVKDLPEEILIDISKLRIGTGIRIKDLNYDSLDFLHADNLMVVQVRTARGAIEDEEEEDEDEEGEEGEGSSEGGEEGAAKEESAEASE
jgi:large subunit ribosomal protein L25